MANIQIPNLPAVASLSGAELLEAVQSGSSVKVSLNQLNALFRIGPVSFPLAVDIGGTGTTTSTGTGSVVLSDGPTLVNPILVGPSIGTATFALGSVGAPSITFTGDTNTGIWSPGADTIAFSEGGVEAMRITSTGNVGIGTTSPAAKLDVSAGSSGATGVAGLNTLTVQNSGAAGIAILTTNSVFGSIAFGDPENGAIGRIRYNHSDDSMLFQTNAAERMRINSAGNVGIGTTTPAAQLQVSGSTNNTAQFTASITGTTMDVTAVTSGTIVVGDIVYSGGVSPITHITALGTGTGGTGTYTVSVSQTVSSTTLYTGSGTASTIRISDTDTGAVAGQPSGSIEFFGSDGSTPGAGVGAYVSAISEDATPDTALTFGTRSAAGGGVDANERMRITSAGNVGIGTSSPGQRLDVNGSIVTTGGTTDQRGMFIGHQNNINTSYVSRSENGVPNTSNRIKFSYTDDSLGFDVNAAERMRIDASGNVGIGTSVPDALLSVNGVASFGDGSAAAPSITNFGDLNTGMFFPAADTIAFSTAGSERYRIGSAGQLGIAGANFGTAGQVVISGGPSAAPAWGQVSLTAGVTGTLPLANGGTGVTTAPAAAAVLLGYTATATAAGTTVLTNTSTQYQLFTGVTTQTITLPVTSTLTTGWSFHIVNNSTGNLTLNSSGGNLVATIIPGTTVMVTCILTSGTTAASWEFGYTDFGTLTGTGSVVMSTSPTLVTPTLGTGSFDLGAEATPSITFTGDLNTGIWSPAADTVAVSTGGSERMRINSTGDIFQDNAVSGLGAIVGEQTFSLAANGTAFGPAIGDFFGPTSAISLDASSVYEVTIYAVFTKTTAGTATWTLTASSAPTRMVGSYQASPITGIAAGADTSSFTGSQGATTAAFAATGSLTTAVNHAYQFRVQLQTNAATNFRLQLTQSAGTATPLAGSYYTVKKISATTGTFVA